MPTKKKSSKGKLGRRGGPPPAGEASAPVGEAQSPRRVSTPVKALAALPASPEAGAIVASDGASRSGGGGFCTVGIGASAGGLEALFAFSSALPASLGMAIVIVTHQSADQPSLLTELLARRSALPVALAAEGLELEPDHVYVCPPGKHLALLDGVFHLSDPVRDGPVPRPIDFFFRSLAADREERSIAIVLSGTGSDGSLGMRAVKAQGGMAFVQDQESAQYPGMPMSAAAALQVDAVLPPRDMPAQLVRLARGSRVSGEPLDGAAGSTVPLTHSVLALLKRRTGHDFSGYKPSVIARRIARRMRVHQLDTVAEYLALLHSHPHELDLLFSELLISVTRFFRDEEAFRSLATLLGPKLSREPERPFRAWVAACSTGEEAYSLGILLAELGADSDRWSKTQVFATDIDPNVIEYARLGLYPEGIAADVGAERLEFSGVQVRSNGEDTLVDVIVQRLGQPDALRGLFRVSLDASPVEPALRAGETRGRHAHLERALQHARGALQGSIEELQGSNEELKSANEELQSTNEELQSSNEELHTAKEEQNSTNEELHAVNLVLRAKMDELSRLNDDMANLLDSTDIATLFLDRQLRIKRFTELAREVINLIPGDVGRPVADLVSKLRYDRLIDDARSVLSTLRPHEVEVQTSQGLWRLVRITPYRTSQNVIEGVAISFLDIDRVKRAELLAGSRALADSVVQTAHEPLVIFDENASIASANPAFLTLFDLKGPSAPQTSLFQVGGGLFASSEMRERLVLLLADGTPFQGVVLDYASSAGSRHLLANGRGLSAPVAVPRYFLLALDEQGRE